LGNTKELKFLDDLKFSDNEKVFSQIENDIDELLNKNNRIISLGGDHSITYPIVKAFGKVYNNLNILHFDAHPDLYDILDGNHYSHACPFARIMENKLATRLVQVGIRTINGHQREQANRFGVKVIDMKNIKNAENIVFDGPVYLSLDLGNMILNRIEEISEGSIGKISVINNEGYWLLSSNPDDEWGLL